jgi:aldehyde dehydrogenase (NAD+)
MKAAAAHLASVTLELGGKSPCIVDESADIPSAAEQIVWAKFLNNGQTCIAPDYILVDQKIEERLLRALTQALKERYPAVDNGLQQSPDYGRVIHAQHFEKLRSQFDDALAKGAVVISGGTFDREDLYIAPTILSKVDDRMALMEDEIFGPLLPVIPFDSIDESIRFINGKEKPLAMYVYTRKSKNAEYILARTSSGNALVNEMLTQFQHPEIPFGGIGNSGTGKTNGFFGFQEFSNAKGVIKRQFGSFKVVYPPFSTLKQKLVTLLTKYL